MIRWRAHRHVLRQPVGWFESDFAGRIANRIMQTPPRRATRCSRPSTRSPSPRHLHRRGLSCWPSRPAAGDAAGAGSSLYRPDPLDDPPRRARVARPRPRCAVAVTGRVVDSLYQHPLGQAVRPSRPRAELCQEAIENARTTFQKEMRIVTKMDVALTLLNGFLIVGVVGLGDLALVTGGDLGVVAAAVGAGPAAEQHDLLDHVGAVLASAEPRRGGRGWRRSPSRHAGRQARRQAAGISARADRDRGACRTTTAAARAGCRT
jgi:ATP-binding cassette, subfamily B, multidrug efflux pump